jgi:hypothetical protein
LASGFGDHLFVLGSVAAGKHIGNKKNKPHGIAKIAMPRSLDSPYHFEISGEFSRTSLHPEAAVEPMISTLDRNVSNDFSRT